MRQIFKLFVKIYHLIVWQQVCLALLWAEVSQIYIVKVGIFLIRYRVSLNFLLDKNCIYLTILVTSTSKRFSAYKPSSEIKQLRHGLVTCMTDALSLRLVRNVLR